MNLWSHVSLGFHACLRNTRTKDLSPMPYSDFTEQTFILKTVPLHSCHFFSAIMPPKRESLVFVYHFY